mgnify:CR=1 FL=1
MKYPKIIIKLLNTELVNNDLEDHISVLGVRYSIVIERENGQTEIGGVAEFEEPIIIDTDPDNPKFENGLPTTHEKVLQNLEHNGLNANFLRSEAHKHGVDMDDKNYPADEYNREKL